jgi:hypothetical protein
MCMCMPLYTHQRVTDPSLAEVILFVSLLNEIYIAESAKCDVPGTTEWLLKHRNDAEQMNGLSTLHGIPFVYFCQVHSCTHNFFIYMHLALI